MKTIYYSH